MKSFWVRAGVLSFGFWLWGCASDSDQKPVPQEAGSSPSVEPSLFDCRAANKEMMRANPVPISCATDRLCTTPLVSGHRGAGGQLGVLAPENTLSSVRAAIVIGSDFIETDPREIQGDVLVNMHDPDVDRTTSGTGEAALMTLNEIQALSIKPGEFVGDFSCERVPTIEDVLVAAKGKIHVLLDANKTSRVDLLVSAVQKTGTIEWAIFDTDSVEKIDEALLLEPNLLTMIRVGDEAELKSELEHFAAHPPVIVEIHSGASAQTMAPLIHAAGHRMLMDAFVTDLAAVVSNDFTLYKDVFESGVDIVQTDRPELAIKSLGR